MPHWSSNRAEHILLVVLLVEANSIFFIQKEWREFSHSYSLKPFWGRWSIFFLWQIDGFFLYFFAENTGKLQIHHVQVPDPFILGSSSDLFCNYSWTGGERESRPIYSIKWYKESAEFFRWVCQWHQKHKCHVQKMLTHLTTAFTAAADGTTILMLLGPRFTLYIPQICPNEQRDMTLELKLNTHLPSMIPKADAHILV